MVGNFFNRRAIICFQYGLCLMTVGNECVFLRRKFEDNVFISSYYVEYRSSDSAVGIATNYGLDDRGVGIRVPVGSRIFSTSSRPALGSAQPIQWVPGALSLGVKRPGREADHSSPASEEVKKMWIYTSIPPYVFMAYCLIS
jgi:hypothetical protein